ncbi:uncharacterized protein LOC105287010 [Ooceraea biroi]|uniref:C2H2-type domain-containing protein n=1 Tax=Ooceraea biroi TaxID=2015173 RepID=A0A026VTP1_OOCBI|nr:uncharacterized protein LOC105287010 [Ooceraea biroi]XP_019889791.1 uncharacterized protein LOC105287010 [Ooceraea biroi]EZA46886.1 hypothetical protein X777_00714 [Ooceraea biroi]
MKNTETYLADVECSQVIILEDADTRKDIANRTEDSTLLPTRSLPNILRNSNIKAHKNCEAPKSHKMDTYSLLNMQHTNTPCELNETLSSTDSDKEATYNKIASSKLHQRKQVHNPLNLQCDAPDWNNNKNKRLQKVARVDTLSVLPKEENISTKKLKSSNNTRKYLYDRKPKKIIKADKTDDIKTKVSNEKPDFDFGLIAVPDVNMNDEVVILQNVDNFLNNDLTFSQSIYESNASGSTNRSCTNKNDIDAGSEELFNVSYCNSEVRDFKRKPYDMNYNPVVSGGLTELNSTQPKTFQTRFTNNEYSLIDDPEGGLMDGDIASSYLFKPKVLYTCTCMNCTSYEDIIFYEEPTSTFTSSDNSEAELYTSDLFDFYSDYYHIFGDILKDSNENLYYEEVEAMDIIRENAHVAGNSTAKVIENGASALSMEQNELQNAPPCHTTKARDNGFETYSAEFIAHSNESKRSSEFTEFTENVNGLDETNRLNLESSSVDKSKATLQNEALAENTVLAETVSASKSKDEQQKKKRDVYVIQCAECGKLFHEKHHFRKHFTRCKFYREDFKCRICDKMYRYKSSLVQHLKKIHGVSYGVPPEKFYTCNKCSKSYIRFRAFQRHILLHDD